MKVLVVTDSRGAGIDAILAEQITGVANIHYAVLPGGNFGRIHSYLEQYEDIKSFNYAALIAGICNFTIKTRGGVYYTTDENVRQAKLQEIEENINSLHALLQPAKVSFATIPPASLDKYLRVKKGIELIPPELVDQQTALLEDIYQANQVIKDWNSSQNNILLNIADYTCVNSLKRSRSDGQVYRRKTKFSDKNLWDGVHYNDELSWKINSRIADIIQQELDKIDSCEKQVASRPPSPQQEEEEFTEREQVPSEAASRPPQTTEVASRPLDSTEVARRPPRRPNLIITITNEDNRNQDIEPRPSTSKEGTEDLDSTLDDPEQPTILELNTSQDSLLSTSSEEWNFKRIKSTIQKPE